MTWCLRQRTCAAALLTVFICHLHATGAEAPTHALSEDGFVRHWLVLGPFPNPERIEPLPDGVTREGFDIDYLTALGGEAAAVIDADTTVRFTAPDGQPHTAQAKSVEARTDGYINLTQVLADNLTMAQQGGSGSLAPWGPSVAYAFAYIDSPIEQEAHFHFGSDDAAKVWVNGQLVHRLWTIQRGATPWSDNFTVHLRAGRNPVLVKIDDRGGGWGFLLEVYDEAVNNQHLGRRYRATAGEWDVEPLGERGYFLHPGAFPAIDWKNAATMRKLVGDLPMAVRWFGPDAEPAQAPTQLGRYAAVVDATTPDGQRLRRAVSLYCINDLGTIHRTSLLQASLHPSNNLAPTAVWQPRQWLFDDYLSTALPEMLARHPVGAKLVAAMMDLRDAPPPPDQPATLADHPATLDHEYQLGVKRRVLGLADDAYPSLAMPHAQNPQEGDPAPVLRDGTPAEAGLADDLPHRLHDICQAWYDASGRPFVALVARRGVIVYHEGFGQVDTSSGAEPVTLETRFNMASITKTITAQMFAQFVDQGLIGLDDPLGRFLPALPTEGDKAVTFRMCYTFSSGFDGHGSWGGMDNPWLELAAATRLPHIQPGREMHYNGDGHNLAAQAMALVAGKSFFRLIDEHYLSPLGVTDATMSDCAFSAHMSTLSLAKISQLILNQGSYGDLTFYGEQTAAALLPRNVKDFYPSLNGWLGIGLYPQGPGVVGGAAASSTVQRIDRRNDLIICIGRMIQGKDYDMYLKAVIDAVDAAVTRPDEAEVSAVENGA
jgi:CubicO group peptidase (beta-lactamase class C family)